jgi:hypothetical protein
MKTIVPLRQCALRASAAPRCSSRAPAAAMVIAPLLLYPFSRFIWLAFDLMFRPVVPNDVTPSPNAR